MSPKRELLPRTNDRLPVKDYAERDDVRKRVDALGLTLAGETLTEKAARDNVVVLAPGVHTLPSVATPGLLVEGFGRALVKSGVLVGSADVVFDGIHFAGVDSPIVTVAAAARVVFRSCVFERTDARLSAADNYVSVFAGGLAIFVGCVFRGAQTAGVIVTNAGGAANVGIVGCSNRTGRAHNNVTTIFEV